MIYEKMKTLKWYGHNLSNITDVKLLNTFFLVHLCDSFIRIKLNKMRNKIEIKQTNWYKLHLMIEKYLYLSITVVVH